MPVTISSSYISNREEKRSYYESLAVGLYKWIKKNKVVPLVNIKIESVELRKEFGFLKGYWVGYLETKGTKAFYRFEPFGDFKEGIYVRAVRGIVNTV